jgi:hypothetical protein
MARRKTKADEEDEPAAAEVEGDDRNGILRYIGPVTEEQRQEYYRTTRLPGQLRTPENYSPSLAIG